jgi:hypothetical protein
MTPEELDNKFTKIVSDTHSEFGKLMVQAGEEALTLIRQRVQEKGEDAEGSPFKPYSTSFMLSGCKGFLNQKNCPAVTQKGRKELKWLTVGRGTSKMRPLFEIPGGYKGFRELNGLQTNHVDFTFSGRMFGNAKVKGDIKVTSNNSEHNSGVVRIGATTELEKKKLAGNTERRGPILKLSQSEIKQVSEDFGIGLVQIWHNNGL